MTGKYTDSPFFAASLALELPESANFLGAGDFDADGHWDLVAAAASGHGLYLLRGDGHGAFAAARSVELPGRVTALVTGGINRDGGELNVVNAKEKRKNENNEEEAKESESAAMSRDLLPSASGLVRATLSSLPQAQAADLALTISHARSCSSGRDATYTFTATNTGPATVAVFIGTSTPVGTTLESSVPSLPAQACWKKVINRQVVVNGRVIR